MTDTGHLDWLEQGGDVLSYHLHLIEKFCPNKENPRILDFGCGMGTVVMYLLQNGYQACGVDIDADILKQAQDAFAAKGCDRDLLRQIQGLEDVDRYRVAGDYRIPFPDDYFDFACSMTVFEHIYKLDDSLCELHRVIKPGGRAFVSFPSSYVIIEPHALLPFVHWIPFSKFREFYIELFNRLNAGQGIDAKLSNEYLDNSVFYRPNHVMDHEIRRYFHIHELTVTDFRNLRQGKPPTPNLRQRISDLLHQTFNMRYLILTKKEK